jgi:hypothetical protein
MSYNLTQITEPSDTQLNELMKSFLKKVIKRAKEADDKFQLEMKKQHQIARNKNTFLKK